MSIADKLTYLNETKRKLREAIESLGYTVGDIPFSQYPNVIDSMVVTEGGDLFQHGQALNYNFTNQRYGTRLPDNTINYTINVNDLGILSRASTATYWGPSRTLLEAAVDEDRIQHEPVTGEALGVLIEPSVTNLAINSEDIAFFGDNPRGVRLAEYVSEFGVTLGHYEVDSSTTFVNYSQWEGGPVVPAGKNVLSFIAKAGTHTEIKVRAVASKAREAVIDLSLGTVTYGEATVTPLPEGWFHVAYTFDMAAEGTPDFRVRPGQHLVDGVDFYLGAVQLEKGSFASSYIPTSGSPVTRAADNAVIDLSDVFNPDEGTLRITAQVPEGEVVASLGGVQVVSDSDEKKTYRMTYSDYTGVPTVTLGNGIHSKLEYFPEAQS